MSSVLVVYSGGLDSYTLLNKAMKKFDRIEAITFNYGQKHNKEIEYAKSNCAELNIKHEVVNLDLENILAGSALVGDIDIPEGNYDKEKMKQTIGWMQGCLFWSQVCLWVWLLMLLVRIFNFRLCQTPFP